MIRKPLTAWKLINRLVDNTEIKEDIKSGTVSYPENNEKREHFRLWPIEHPLVNDAVKLVL